MSTFFKKQYRVSSSADGGGSLDTTPATSEAGSSLGSSPQGGTSYFGNPRKAVISFLI